MQILLNMRDLKYSVVNLFKIYVIVADAYHVSYVINVVADMFLISTVYVLAGSLVKK
jgi:hypothetical protein